MPAITLDNCVDAMVDYLTTVSPVANCVRGYANRVPLPADPAIVISDTTRTILETPTAIWDDPNGTVILTVPMKLGLQLDFYGATAGDVSHAVQTSFKSMWGAAQFPDFIKPLYCDDAASRAPLVTGEEQYDDRWILNCYLQYNSDVTVTQDYFDTVGDTACIPADLFYQ